MYIFTKFLCPVLLLIFLNLLNIPVSAQNSDTLFYEPFNDMTNWTPVGPEGFNNWSISNSNFAGGYSAPEVRFTWEYLFVGESYLLATPVFNGVQGHNMELKFNYYEDYWSNIVYVGVAITGDGGNTYNSIWELQANGNSGPELVTVDFTGIDNMQIALYYLGDANDIDFWYVDDVSLMDMDAVPVELTFFIAKSLNGNVNLNWSTASETNNKGFQIDRSQNGQQNWESLGFVNGNGTTTGSHSYSYSDKNVKRGIYSYRLKQVDLNGTFKYSDIVNVDVKNIPSKFALAQNYPNPFNPSTTISFALPVDAGVNISIYNILGQKITQLINNQFPAGFHNVTFNAANLSSGLYFYMLEAKGSDGSVFRSIKKMMLTK